MRTKVDYELLSSAIKRLEDLSKWRNFIFNGRELDTETWECTDCGYRSTVRAATNQETASYSFHLQLHSLGYQLGEIDCKRISYTNYKFLSEILKKFDDGIEDHHCKPDIKIIEPYCELFADPKTPHKCKRAPVALTEESILDEIIQRRKHSPRRKRT